MVTINIHEAKTQLSRLLARASNGEEIVIAKAGKAVARLVPVKRPQSRRKPGLDRGKAWIADDFTTPLPAEIRSFFE